MADIATVFHWAPSEMWAMSIEEISEWRERAQEQFKASRPVVIMGYAK